MSNLTNAIISNVKNWWWFIIKGLLLITAGVAIFSRPVEGYAAGALSIVAYSASAFFVAGIFNIVLAFKFKAIKKDVKGFEGKLKQAVGLQ
jgi:uncharacterized membrane protein HdeD (DUF308 family)